MPRIFSVRNQLHAFGRRCTGWIVGLAVASAPLLVWADTAAPNPTLKKSPPAWLGILIMFVLLGMVLFVSLMPSKRGHQD